MDIKLFYTVSLVSIMTLCWTTTEAAKCYDCMALRRQGDDIPETSCAGGKFSKLNDTERAPYIKDCGVLGCYKEQTVYKELEGIEMYVHGCADSYHDETCLFVSSDTTYGANCYCQGDYCNGAVSLHSHHAIIALVTSVFLVVMAKRGM